MRLAVFAACANASYVLIDGRHSNPCCRDHFSKRRAALALRQPTGPTFWMLRSQWMFPC